MLWCDDPEELIAIMQAENPAVEARHPFTDALIGIAYHRGDSPVLCYDLDACIDILVNDFDLTPQEARERIEIASLPIDDGPGTCVFMERMGER